MSNLFGYWRIVEGPQGHDLELEIDGPAHLSVDEDGRVELTFFLFDASVDARLAGDRLEFSWDGQWELDDMSGRGAAKVTADGDLVIHLWIHLGDEMQLRAVRG